MPKIALEKRLLTIFLLQGSANWTYVLWANSQPNVITSWCALSSLLGFIYFAFAIIAAYGILAKSRQGIIFACCVIGFGMICDVISYSQAFQHHRIGEMVIIPLIILSTVVIIYLASYQSSFNKQ